MNMSNSNVHILTYFSSRRNNTDNSLRIVLIVTCTAHHHLCEVCDSRSQRRLASRDPVLPQILQREVERSDALVIRTTHCELVRKEHRNGQVFHALVLEKRQ